MRPRQWWFPVYTRLEALIRHPKVKRLTTNVRSVDQFSDSHELLQRLSILRRLSVTHERGL